MHFMTDAPDRPTAAIILAHGAGAPMDSPFMAQITAALLANDFAVHRLEFAYMAARRQGGRRRPAPRGETLTGEYEAAVDHVRAAGTLSQPLFIGGKSLGGRVASLIADEAHAAGRIAGLVCLGYPFHPPRKPDRLRTSHLETMNCPALIVQGTRDPLGTQEEVATYQLDPRIKLHWLEDGDHDFKPRVRSGFTQADHIATLAAAIARFAAANATIA